jgi:adenylate cyclase class 2
MDGPKETEVKLRLASAAAARDALRRAGARLVHERHFEDNVLLDDAAGTLRARGSVLRLRETPAGGLLTFKGPRAIADGVKSRVERETAVGEPGEALAILEGLGYRPVFRYQKFREGWQLRGQEIAVDETPIGDYLEIEGDAEGIHAAAADLGFSRAEYVADSYVGLFLAGGGRGDMVFPE